MAQQTRLSTVLPYFLKWMKVFPTINDLAFATEQEVLLIWEGLGYYSRARNLHKAAQQVNSHFDGVLPDTVEMLMKLPGIGKYTAGAISSIAFGKDEAVVDGNVKRVLARVFVIETEINTSKGEKEIWGIAEKLFPSGDAGNFNQALMELGAFVCKPKTPGCGVCPINQECKSYNLGLVGKYPIKKSKAKIPHLNVSAAIIFHKNQYLIAQRPEKGLLANLWEFPGGKHEESESPEDALIREINEELGIQITIENKFGVFKHTYTHFKVSLHAFIIKKYTGKPSGRENQTIKWVRIDRLTNYPMGKIDRLISNKLILNGK